MKAWITASTKNKVITRTIVTVTLALVIGGTMFALRDNTVNEPVVTVKEDLKDEVRELKVEFAGEDIEVELGKYLDIPKLDKEAATETEIEAHKDFNELIEVKFISAELEG